MKSFRVTGSAFLIALTLVQFQPKPAHAIIGTLIIEHNKNGQNNAIDTTGWVLAGVGALMTGYLVPVVALVATLGLGSSKSDFDFNPSDPIKGGFHWGPFSAAGVEVNLLGVVLLATQDGFTGQYAPIASEQDAAKLKMTSAEEAAYNHELDTINVMAQDFVGRAQEYIKTSKSDDDTKNYIHSLWETVAKPNLSSEAYSGLTKVSDSLLIPAQAK